MAALFGQCRFEDFPQIDDNGRPTTYATPHLRQFVHDVSVMRDLPGLDWVWEEIDLSIPRLFQRSHLSAAFCDFDFSVLRRIPNSICIPPPEWTPTEDPNVIQPTWEPETALNHQCQQHTERYMHI
jgi:hypothetical protein